MLLRLENSVSRALFKPQQASGCLYQEVHTRPLYCNHMHNFFFSPPARSLSASVSVMATTMGSKKNKAFFVQSWFYVKSYDQKFFRCLILPWTSTLQFPLQSFFVLALWGFFASVRTERHFFSQQWPHTHDTVQRSCQAREPVALANATHLKINRGHCSGNRCMGFLWVFFFFLVLDLTHTILVETPYLFQNTNWGVVRGV